MKLISFCSQKSPSYKSIGIIINNNSNNTSYQILNIHLLKVQHIIKNNWLDAKRRNFGVLVSS
jgi:hypothetical protein